MASSISTSKPQEKASKPALRRSARKNAGKRKQTYFEEYAVDIMKVYMEGEDTEEVLKALKEEDASFNAKAVEEEEYVDESESDEEMTDVDDVKDVPN